jgi:putative endonuclease
MKTEPYFVYIVHCRDGSLYTGITTNVEERITAHNSGNGARYTNSRRPVRLAYVEPQDDKSAALKREYAIKQYSRETKLALIASKR